jgi:hypothetical protein
VIPEEAEELSQSIDETSELLAKVIPRIGTQICESFHSRKDKLAPKDFDWQGSWKARVARAVLDIIALGGESNFIIGEPSQLYAGKHMK